MTVQLTLATNVLREGKSEDGVLEVLTWRRPAAIGSYVPCGSERQGLTRPSEMDTLLDAQRSALTMLRVAGTFPL